MKVVGKCGRGADENIGPWRRDWRVRLRAVGEPRAIRIDVLRRGSELWRDGLRLDWNWILQRF